MTAPALPDGGHLEVGTRVAYTSPPTAWAATLTGEVVEVTGSSVRVRWDSGYVGVFDRCRLDLLRLETSPVVQALTERLTEATDAGARARQVADRALDLAAVVLADLGHHYTPGPRHPAAELARLRRMRAAG